MKKYYVYGQGQIGEVKYIPDGKGEKGDETNAKQWHVKIADTKINQEQKNIIDAWQKNKGKFKDENDLVDEDKLIKFLSKKFSLSANEVNNKITPFFLSYPNMKNFFKEGENHDFSIDNIGIKSTDSITNPTSFSISACQQDLQCWGEKT